MTTKLGKLKGRKLLPEPALPLEKETVSDVEDEKSEEEESEEEEESASESEDQNDDEQGIPLSDLDSDAGDGDVDLVSYQKIFKDNHAALTQALSTFALALPSLPFHVHQSVTSSESVTIDVNDDLSRELAFYKQALEAAKEARKNLLAEGTPFSRPSDYFAEMVKDDEHMNKVRPFKTMS
jgi:rRNA-processing protein EBP2